MKAEFKNRAINLRKQGLSYSEILNELPVAKSTLALWLQSVGLSKKQKQRITEKRIDAARRGAQKRKDQRIKSSSRIILQASQQIQSINKRELCLIGTMLYWAEGSKEKEYKLGSGVIFSNSDPMMIRIFIKWLRVCLSVSLENLLFSIYIHENHKNNIHEVQKYWSSVTGFSISRFDKIYFKRHQPKSNRRNIGNKYHGQLKIRVRKSTNLYRKIAGWITGVEKNCGVV